MNNAPSFNAELKNIANKKKFATKNHKILFLGLVPPKNIAIMRKSA